LSRLGVFSEARFNLSDQDKGQDALALALRRTLRAPPGLLVCACGFSLWKIGSRGKKRMLCVVNIARQGRSWAQIECEVGCMHAKIMRVGVASLVWGRFFPGCMSCRRQRKQSPRMHETNQIIAKPQEIPRHFSCCSTQSMRGNCEIQEKKTHMNQTSKTPCPSHFPQHGNTLKRKSENQYPRTITFPNV
jgi:hypothetical protein